MPSGEAPRLRVVSGGGLSGGAIGGVRLRLVDSPPHREAESATAHRGPSPRGDGRAMASGRDGSAGRDGPPGGGVFDWRAELELVAPDVLLPPGCSRQAIAAAEGSLGWALPPQQIEFLTAADGVYDVDCHHWYAWSLERLVDENFEPERPSDLLLIGDDASSGWFCLPLDGAGALHYDRITGMRRTLARDLRGLWLGWFGGTIGV